MEGLAASRLEKEEGTVGGENGSRHGAEQQPEVEDHDLGQTQAQGKEDKNNV